ncbi:HlyD family type I secretion periplasmic adaptor subunit [Ottowia testudinis]|uniref:Membrane fusion protein (MFP) family protein n=1 Tax=Ottowia testudinis TaxID=2816950 RepID=A0A975CJL9_9BURK|nr:HlyD family type I secretion periplasmic adaptor subunit [Ottowia testudinis]QTD45389.1 HlyD family type I secretion periplasmic adaptor subunit [Ottowia testudinis]
MSRKSRNDWADTRVARDDLPLLNDLQAALQHERHWGMLWTIGLLALLLATFVVWAYFSNVEEVTRGQGSVIPSSREQIIQSLDPGTLSEMLVKEGDLVDAGQALVRLDTVRSSAVYREAQNKVEALQAAAARLRSEAHGVPLRFPPEVSRELVTRETAAYQARTRAVSEMVAGLQRSKALLDKEIAITEPMAAKGVVSEVEILRMKRQSNELQLQMTDRRTKFQSDANTELVRVEAELAQSSEAAAARADPVARAEIKAPLRGVVKNIKINTVGGVIGAGQDIMEIVPVEGPLLVEAYVRPQDVAFIKPNDEAMIKLTAYDYALYGGLEGRVKLISPDTLQDNRRPSELKLNPDESFYRVIVETRQNNLVDKNGKPMPIIPGMIASVDIKTGEKTVFQYLVKPITRLKQALRER